MKLWVALVCIAACGGTQSSQQIDTRDKFVAWHQQEMKTKQARCNKGNHEACAEYGMDLIWRFTTKAHPDWVDDSYPLDPVKAKAILYPFCSGGEAETAIGACWKLVENVKLEPDEYDKLCFFMDCANIAQLAKLDDKGLDDLCLGHMVACRAALARVQDARIKAEIAPLAELGEILAIVNKRAEESKQAAETSGDDADDDDDNKCHKDTDCKGDRICDKGSCVDAKAPKPAAPAAPPFAPVAFKSDMCNDASKYVTDHVPGCVALEKDLDAIHDHLVKAAQLETNAQVGCSTAGGALKVAIEDLHCVAK